MPEPEEVTAASDLFGLLASPTRLRLLCALRQGESSVTGLAERVGANPAAVSQHLAKLRLAHVVAARSDGTYTYYRAADARLGPLLATALPAGGLTERSATTSAR